MKILGETFLNRKREKAPQPSSHLLNGVHFEVYPQLDKILRTRTKRTSYFRITLTTTPNLFLNLIIMYLVTLKFRYLFEYLLEEFHYSFGRSLG